MQTVEYKVGINDNKIWGKDLLAIHLYQCFLAGNKTVLNVTPEGSSCTGNGLYRHLDTFCETTGYSKGNITIRTGNMIEQHDQYAIEKDATAWFEVPIIQRWMRENNVTTGTAPVKHFGHFIGKSNWHRIWIAAVLHSRYADKSFQTFNSGLNTQYVVHHDGLVDFVGLEDLIKTNCDVLAEVIEFLKTCPRTIAEDQEAIKQCATYIKQDNHYPIQFPANLNVLNYYSDIFVDVVHETFVRDQVCFATEKTWRPIIARRPFITMAGVGHLANLRRLGFRTFNEFWDEGYDDCGMGNRVQQILTQLEIISCWDQTTMTQKLHDMKDILDHNYQVLQTLTHSKIQRTFNA